MGGECDHRKRPGWFPERFVIICEVLLFVFVILVVFPVSVSFAAREGFVLFAGFTLRDGYTEDWSTCAEQMLGSNAYDARLWADICFFHHDVPFLINLMITLNFALSLNHDLTSILNVEALGGLFYTLSAQVEGRRLVFAVVADLADRR